MSEAERQARRARALARRSLDQHARYRGKIQLLPKCPVRELADFSLWYTPGVAAASRAIVEDPARVDELTNRGNTVAVVSDGSRVLGLGDIGPRAGLPVMEGKALLFKYLGGVDAVPLCLDVGDPARLAEVVLALQPSFAGINLEDISQPRCFRLLEQLRAAAGIPVWHDDQQGTAVVVIAGLLNALTLVDKHLDQVRIAMIGIGAANFASYRLLGALGVDPGRIVACDSGGILHRGREELSHQRERWREKWQVCCDSNADGRTGGIAEALAGADVCLAFSQPGPGVIAPEWIAAMAQDAIVFACANPVPEVWPADAAAAGARIVATGRSDFPNQVNNSLAFPGIFRGVLDVRARTISDTMAIAAAHALAAAAEEHGLSPERILPTMDDWRVAARLAAATGMAAQAEGLAALTVEHDALLAQALKTISTARAATRALMDEGLIAAPEEVT